MSVDSTQSSDSTQSAKQSPKRRRKPAQKPGRMLRDFLERTGLNEDLEDLVAHVARQGISNLWESFTPLTQGQSTFNLPPDEPCVQPNKDDPDDPYVIMGIHRNTPPEIMKAVYLAWAKHHHPDVGGDADTFKRVNVAWDKIKKEKGL